MSKKAVAIVAAKRTPIGSLLGNLSSLTAPQLGGIVLQDIAAIVPPSVMIDHIIMGCVLTAGMGQAPARQAAHYAGLSSSIPAFVVNNVCGSGLKSIMLGCDMIQLGQANCVLAGGMESMSSAPYLLPGSRQGYRFGHKAVQDHMMLDGLQNAYDGCESMGLIAEKLAARDHYSRAQQDEFALESVRLAKIAAEQGAFKGEIIPVTIRDKGQDNIISTDEAITKLRPEKIPTLKPAFKPDGTITAANASSINDGAAGVTLMCAQQASACNINPLAHVIAYASVGVDPQWFTTAPIAAIKKVCEMAGWNLDQVDLFEINEAFAVVVLAAINHLKIDPAKVNINGGGCALGHPIGASGARILVTLIHALKARNLKRGIATLCIGGGEGIALAIECP